MQVALRIAAYALCLLCILCALFKFQPVDIQRKSCDFYLVHSSRVSPETLNQIKMIPGDQIYKVDDEKPAIWAQASLRQSPEREAVILDWSDGSVVPSVPGFQSFVIPLFRDDESGVALRGLWIPEQARVSRPFSIKVSLFALHGQKAKIQIFVGDKLNQEKEFDSVAGELSQSLVLESESAGLQKIRVEIVEGAAKSATSTLTGFIEVLPKPKVALHGNAGPIGPILEKNGFEIVGETSAGASDVDVHIVAKQLEDPTKVLDSVRAGAGLLVFARESFSWPLDLRWVPALPVTLESPEEAKSPSKEVGENPATIPGTPPVAPPPEVDSPRKELKEAGLVSIALVLDRSGSMAGEKIEKARQSAIATAKTLSGEDYITVIGFNSEPSVVVPLQKVKDLFDLEPQVEKLEAGGGTRVYPAMKIAAESLRSVAVAVRHIILLTDGVTEDSLEAPYYDFVRQLASEGITVSSIGIRGVEFDSDFLSNVALWGHGKFYPVDSDRLPQVFTLEANRVLKEFESNKRPPKSEIPSEAPPKKPPEDPAPTPNLPERFFHLQVRELHPVLAGLRFDGAAPFQGVWPANPALGASVPIEIQETEKPLLAIRFFREGKVAAWMSDAGKSWSQDFLSGGVGQTLIVQVVEYLRRRDREIASPWVAKVRDSVATLYSSKTFDSFSPEGVWKDVFAAPLDGDSHPDRDGFRFWRLGASSGEQLESKENRFREIAVQAQANQARIVESVEQFNQVVQRGSRTQDRNWVPYWTMAALIFLFAGLVLEKKLGG